MQKTLIVLVACISFCFSKEVCNVNNPSMIYQQWNEQWGKFKQEGCCNNKPQIIRWYFIDADGVFVDMMRECDIVGMKQLLIKLGKGTLISLQKAESRSYLLLVAQENFNQEVITFLLENHLFCLDKEQCFDSTFNVSQSINEKLKEAKFNMDTKATQNYKQILNLLR